MGILDVLNGMMNGPRGSSSPQPGGESKGMSPITLALLALLAYKAWQHMGSGSQTAPETGSPFPLPKPGETTANSGGGLGDLLGQVLGGGKGGTAANSGGVGDLLGGLLGGAAAGSVLNGGLGELLKQFQKSGQGQVADSWVGTGKNEQIAPREIEKTLGSDILDALVRQTGASKSEVLADLSKNLPGLIDTLTPNGKLPTDKEFSRFL